MCLLNRLSVFIKHWNYGVVLDILANPNLMIFYVIRREQICLLSRLNILSCCVRFINRPKSLSFSSYENDSIPFYLDNSRRRNSTQQQPQQ